MAFESRLMGTVVPAVAPLLMYMDRFARFSGRDSPTQIVLLVPSVIPLIDTICE